MSKVREIQVLRSDGRTEKCSIEHSESAPWKLSLSGLQLDKTEFTGNDLFEALIELRRELEKGNCQLLCAGARPNVFPSGMSRGMGGGLRAYAAKMGEPARQSDLVDIFDYASPEIIGSVEDQKQFRDEWADSLRNL